MTLRVRGFADLGFGVRVFEVRGFVVPDFGFGVSGLGFRGSGFRVRGFAARVYGFWFGVSGLSRFFVSIRVSRFRVSGSGIHRSGFRGFQVQCF